MHDGNGLFVIMTGGTIASEAYPDPKNPPKNATPLAISPVPDVVSQLAHRAGATFDDYTYYQLLQKDSKDIDDRDLRSIANIIRNQSQKYFILTHGTDTMAENSRKLELLLEGSGKVVAMTGAFVPLQNQIQGTHQSDGFENLEYIIRNIKDPSLFPEGVHVVIRGQDKKLSHFRPNGLRKNYEQLYFYPTDNDDFAEMRRRASWAETSRGDNGLANNFWRGT